MGFFEFSSNFLSKLYVVTIIVFSLLLHEVVLMIRPVTCYFGLNRNPLQSTAADWYLALVEKKHPTVTYEDGSRPKSIDCAVCLCEFERGEEIRELQCKHVFHKDCLDTWLEHKWATCPVCRSSILPDEALIEELQKQQSHCGEERLGLWFHSFHGGGLHVLP